MQMISRVGKRVKEIVKSGTEVHLAGGATRLLEEATELALELGADSASIYDAIGDTLSKEAKKEGRFPSSLFKPVINEADLKEELADTYLHLLYLMEISGFDLVEIEDHVFDKLARLEDHNASGNLEFHSNGKFYRKKQSNV